MDKQITQARGVDGYLQAGNGFSPLRNRRVVALDLGQSPLVFNLEGFVPLLASADSHGLLDGEDENLSVTDFLGFGSL